jgi:hypothetical protein
MSASTVVSGRHPSGFGFVESFAFGFAEPEGVPSEAEGTHPVVACRAKPDALPSVPIQKFAA